MGLDWVNTNPPAVESQEHIGREEGDALVPIKERMVHEERLEEGGRHLDDVGVVAGPGAVEGALEKSEVANLGGSAEPLDQRLMNREDFVDRDHSASKRPSFSLSAIESSR